MIRATCQGRARGVIDAHAGRVPRLVLDTGGTPTARSRSESCHGGARGLAFPAAPCPSQHAYVSARRRPAPREYKPRATDWRVVSRSCRCRHSADVDHPRAFLDHVARDMRGRPGGDAEDVRPRVCAQVARRVWHMVTVVAGEQQLAALPTNRDGRRRTARRPELGAVVIRDLEHAGRRAHRARSPRAAGEIGRCRPSTPFRDRCASATVRRAPWAAAAQEMPWIDRSLLRRAQVHQLALADALR